MKVLQITAFEGWGCTGRISLEIHNMLVSEGNESIVAWGRKNTAPANAANIKIGNKADQLLHGLYTRITDKCGFASKKITKDFLKKVDAYKPDLIHLHIMHGYYINIELLFNYIKSKNIPVVWTMHDCWAFTGHCPYFDYINCEKWKTGCHNCSQKQHHPTSWFIDNSKWNWQKKRELFSGVKNMTIVTPSKWLSDLVKQSFFNAYPIEVINNGINLKYFKPTYGTFKEDYCLKNKKIILGISSTWVKSKGLDDFIKLSHYIPQEYIIVLIGLKKSQIKQLPNNILGIEHIDNIEKLAETYTSADVFVNPTYEDNYPTTNLEAIACGTPVVTYNTGGSIEAVLKSGFGAIVEKGNIKQLKNEILNSQNIFAKYDKVKITQICQQEISFLKYCKLYNKVLEESNNDRNH